MRKILSLTGSRSDYVLMTPVYQAIAKDRNFQLEMIVTGQHLLPEFSGSLAQIRKDRFARLYLASSASSSKNTNEFFSSVTSEVSRIIKKSHPDILLLQGDRGEMLAAALAGIYQNIMIVHMSGGDYSGSVDDSVRNAISKLAQIHLVTCQKSAERLRKIGENKNRIFIVGDPIIDLIKKMNFISAKDLAQEFKLDLSKPLILAAHHPVVTEFSKARLQAEQTLQALEGMNVQTIFTYPNNDPGREEIIAVLKSNKAKNIQVIPNLDAEKYLSLMKISSVMVGNSSSGIVEAPSFQLPAVNIGTRQFGRLKAKNVIDVAYNRNEIQRAIRFALGNKQFRLSLKKIQNPYGDGETAQKTLEILKNTQLKPELLAKWMDKK
jgi:UDP-hydrolysing UDP-N-acetyl-D-glucosamine 2-epimerase